MAALTGAEQALTEPVFAPGRDAAEGGASAFPRARRRHWTDWVGFVAGLALGAKVIVLAGGIGLLMVPTLLHASIVALLFLTRAERRAASTGIVPQLVAYGAAFLFPTFVAASSFWRPDWLAPSASDPAVQAGLVLWLIGAVMGLWPLWYMRRSFSLAPQARHLVTAGPYHLARHPIYAMYLLQYVGTWLSHATIPLALALIAWFLLLSARIRYEEAVLANAFPEYREYQRRVGAFGPRLLRPVD